jgi:uncharacterized protein YbjT (DUF2867 family)
MRVLVTGANGYIGRRLIPSLIEQGHTVIAMVRSRNTFRDFGIQSDQLKVVEADLLDKDSLDILDESLDAAYFLVHSMSAATTSLVDTEVAVARNFVQMVERLGVKQIIYLGGIYNSSQLSKHLESRRQVELELGKSSIPVTALRSAIIVGSGSASFEIIRDLVEKLPVMITPKWLNTRCQPIAIRDCIRYLVGVLGNPEAKGKSFDIGGPKVYTYKEMLLLFAKQRGVKRYIFTLPVLSPKLSSYWLTLVTAVPFRLASSLVDSLKNDVVVQNHEIKTIIPGECINYPDAVDYAFLKIQTSDVFSNWSDDENFSKEILQQMHVPTHACYKDVRVVEILGDPEMVRKRIWSIGGEHGWYHGRWLWEIRGLLDKMIGGVGLRRGRRNPDSIIAGDVIDFWRVLIASENSCRLLLYAEMKVPGEAWLEFKIVTEGGVNKLVQVATFRPRGLLGRMYWYSILPLHFFIFPGMAKKIANP